MEDRTREPVDAQNAAIVDHGDRSACVHVDTDSRRVMPSKASIVPQTVDLQSLLVQFRRMKLTDYFSNTWNWIDATAIVLYLVGFVTRFFVDEVAFTVSK